MKNRILNYALCLVALVSTVVALPYLPDSVPMHFDINGAVDRYGSKYEMLFIPAILILLNVLSEFGLLRVSRNGRDPESRAVIYRLCSFFVIFYTFPFMESGDFFSQNV